MSRTHHHSFSSDTAALDVLTTIGTIGAVIAAAIGTIVALVIANRQRSHETLIKRLEWATDLLAAFEAVQQLRPPGTSSAAERNVAVAAPELQQARARYLALIRISQEDMRINIGANKHIPFGSTPEEAGHLASAAIVGDPEVETDLDMQCRGEIIKAITALQNRITA